MAGDAAQPHEGTGDPAALADQDGVQQRQEIAVFSVVDKFDVGVVVNVDAAADGHIVPGFPVLRHTHRQYGFAVGADQFTQSVADVGQRVVVFTVGQQLVGSQ